MGERKSERRAVPPGGRSRREEGGRRHTAFVRMNDEEFALIQGRAIAMGVSVPRALVEATTGVPPLTRTQRKALHQELAGIKLLLGNLTNNVNQIAKKLNSDVDVPTREIRAVLERAAVAVGRVDDIAESYRTS